MKRLPAILLALSIALTVCAWAEEDDGGEGILYFPDEAQTDLAVSDTDLSSVEPFAPDTLEKVIVGKDDRVKVKKPKQYPYSAICYMDGKYECGCRWTGTGFMVSENTLLTCAHLLVCKEHGKWAKKMTFYFGYKNRKNYLYRYKSTWYGWVGTKFPNGYSSDAERDDWAVVRLDKKVGEKTGWFGMRFCSDDDLSGRSFCVAGFGGEDKLRYAWGEVTNVWEKQIGYTNDTLPGNSGSPVFDDNNYAVAINTSHRSSQNIGRRLMSDVRQVMVNNGLL